MLVLNTHIYWSTIRDVHYFLGLIASGYLNVPDALLALDVATPVELALAPLHPPLPSRGVAAVTAKQVAPVYTLRRLKNK